MRQKDREIEMKRRRDNRLSRVLCIYSIMLNIEDKAGNINQEILTSFRKKLI